MSERGSVSRSNSSHPEVLGYFQTFAQLGLLRATGPRSFQFEQHASVFAIRTNWWLRCG